MLQPSPPARQQAHDLVDRINPQHLAVAISMLRTMADAGQAVPLAELGMKPDDTDYWPEQNRASARHDA